MSSRARYRRWQWAAPIVATGLLFVGCSSDDDDDDDVLDVDVDPGTVLSISVDGAPSIDGSGGDAAWAGAPALDFSTSGGANSGSSTGTIKSVYTTDSVYFLVQWTDPTESNERFPWVKQADGSWSQKGDTSSHDENEFYEDKFAFIWDTSNAIAGFDTGGCMVTCHAGEPNKPYGNKYTASEGEIGDIWHWKGIRSNPMGYVDDQWLDDTRWSEETSGAGRHGDPKDSGGYKNNRNEAGDAPLNGGSVPPYWLATADAQPFNDADYAVGDQIPGILVERPTGDRGDIDGKATYAGGKWTLEIGRKLSTGSAKDVQFGDLTAAYKFGVANFDNAQVRHSMGAGVQTLRFGE
jgi:hypothetical protein